MAQRHHARDGRRVSRRPARTHAGGLLRDATAALTITVDVIVTENMFGDILTDEASMLAGSMGMLPSRRWAIASTEVDLGCTSRSTARRPTSRAVESRTRSARSSASRCCCGTRWSRERGECRGGRRGKGRRRRMVDSGLARPRVAAVPLRRWAPRSWNRSLRQKAKRKTLSF